MLKELPISFSGTGLEQWLRRNGINTITLTGYMTHNCAVSTAIHGAHLGLGMEPLSDATGSLPNANGASSATRRGDAPDTPGSHAGPFRSGHDHRPVDRRPEQRGGAQAGQHLRLQPAGAEDYE